MAGVLLEPAREVPVIPRCEGTCRGGRAESGGLGREFEERAKAMGAAMSESQSLSWELDSEGCKLVAEWLVEEAGIREMLHRAFVAPVMEGDAIAGVIVESKTGREAILAERVIDTTGDADIAHRAGAPCVKTPLEEVHDSGEMINMTLLHLAGSDYVDPDSLTRFEVEGRKQAMDVLRHHTPGREDARLGNFGMSIGIRDPRKIDAACNMTEADVRGQGRFDDSVGIFPEFIDGDGILILPTMGRYMQVPYRSMRKRATWPVARPRGRAPAWLRRFRSGLAGGCAR